MHFILYVYTEYDYACYKFDPSSKKIEKDTLKGFSGEFIFLTFNKINLFTQKCREMFLSNFDIF